MVQLDLHCLHMSNKKYTRLIWVRTTCLCSNIAKCRHARLGTTVHYVGYVISTKLSSYVWFIRFNVHSANLPTNAVNFLSFSVMIYLTSTNAQLMWDCVRESTKVNFLFKKVIDWFYMMINVWHRKNVPLSVFVEPWSWKLYCELMFCIFRRIILNTSKLQYV